MPPPTTTAALALRAPAHDVAGVVHAVELDDAVQLGARYAGGCPGPGREQQAIVDELPAALQRHPVGGGVEAARRLARSNDVRRRKSSG